MDQAKHIIPFPKNEKSYKLRRVVEKKSMQLFDFELDKNTSWRQIQLHGTTFESIQPYLPSQRAKEAIELAQILARPILLQGEPGSGKTKLAQAVAYDWYGSKYKSKYFEWHIKSSEKAQDGIYTFDHVARLRDATIPSDQTSKKGSELTDLKRYLRLGPLGKAFLASSAKEPAILLIDEIDKADIDFPNDLLLEIDEKRFKIKEPGIDQMYTASHPPLIFITSNKEKGLPPAFLRRCLYLYFKFPNEERLRKIIKARYKHSQLIRNTKLQKSVIQRFEELRLNMLNDPSTNRVTSTSEFLDWLHAVEYELWRKGQITLEEIQGLKFSPTLLKNTDELKMENLFENIDD